MAASSSTAKLLNMEAAIKSLSNTTLELQNQVRMLKIKVAELGNEKASLKRTLDFQNGYREYLMSEVIVYQTKTRTLKRKIVAQNEENKWLQQRVRMLEKLRKCEPATRQPNIPDRIWKRVTRPTVFRLAMAQKIELFWILLACPLLSRWVHQIIRSVEKMQNE